MVELASVSGELADDGRRIESALVSIDEIDVPLLRLGIVEPEGLRLDVKALVLAPTSNCSRLELVSKILWWFEMPSYSSQ
ncbi:MAG TPA: hypothetical protein VF742_16160 [Terracidiphilus sp.]